MRSSLIVLIAALALCGCRREDVRTVTIEIPGLRPEQQQTVADSLNRYNGVRKDSYKWDFSRGAVTVTYDSMQVAQTNLRMAIEEKGLKVVYPENRSGVAGYIDQTEK